MSRIAVASMVVLLAPCAAQAKDFYVDPATGSSAGDGSVDKPWKTIQEVLEANLVETQNWSALPYVAGTSVLAPKNAGAPIKAGDTVWLRSGNHGTLLIQSAYNQSPITIAAQQGHTPQVARIHVQSGSGWIVRGLEVSPTFAATYATDTMVFVENHGWRGPSHDVTIEGCRVFSVEDTSAWTDVDWNDKSANGITVQGDEVTVRGNTLKNVNFGIQASGKNDLIEKNVVENFAGDGLRGLGDYEVFQYNTVKNCYAVNANHDDGFQSWSVGADGKVGTGEVKGIVLRGNFILNYSDPNQPYRGTLQGIGCFDGFYVDWVVENNVIVTDHWHGITLLGARNVRIVNNTVLDLNDTSPGPPWISIGKHKDGRASEDIVVRNNLATDFTLEATRLTDDHNTTLTAANTAALFVNAPADVHLKEGSPAIDTGSPDLAPTVDLEGVPRPQGAAVDLGAYEFHTGPIAYPDGGMGPADAAATAADTGTPSASDSGAGLVTDGGAAAVADGGGSSVAPSGCGCAAGVGAGPMTWLGLALLIAGRRSRLQPGSHD
ncbi:MAG TPA: choice-of-anchor Q domain-containing protein [Myxococcales bacterium]|jgi:hypothetical protein